MKTSLQSNLADDLKEQSVKTDRTRHGTGPRPKIAESLDVTYTEAPEPQRTDLHPSVAPESLRRPYSSLMPRKRMPSEPDSLSTPSEGFTSIRPRPARANCKKHRIARGDNGECLLCEKEAAQQKSDLIWKLFFSLIFVAALGASLAALLR